MYRIKNKEGKVIHDRLFKSDMAMYGYDWNDPNIEIEHYIPCRECGGDGYERYDFYGISTGYWCDECYLSDNYPYRRDAYFDPGYAGERLDEDY